MFYVKIYHRSVQKIMPSLRPIGWRERYSRRGERSSVAIAKRTDFRTARAWYHVEPREGASSGDQANACCESKDPSSTSQSTPSPLSIPGSPAPARQAGSAFL